MKSNWYCKYKLAHRGLHNTKFPENSLGAFENAMNLNFAIELDVRLLKDGTVVVFHDHNLRRVCNEDIDLNELNKEDLSKYKLFNTNYTIPTLKEVLTFVNGKVPIMIELKPVRRKEKLSQKVYDLIKNYKGDIAVKSFNPFAVIWFKKHAPKIPRGMLSSFFDGIYLPFLYKPILKKLRLFKYVKPDFISYDINNLPNKYVSQKQVPIIAWTITSKEMEKIAFKHADNIIFENYLPSNPINY